MNDDYYQGWFIFLNNNTDLKLALEYTIKYHIGYLSDDLNAWMGVDEGLKSINKTIPYPKKI